MKNTIAKIATLVLTLAAASFASASPFVTITDNYLYESLIQAEFDIETSMNNDVEISAQISQELVFTAKTDTSENVEKAVEVAAE